MKMRRNGSTLKPPIIVPPDLEGSPRSSTDHSGDGESWIARPGVTGAGVTSVMVEAAAKDSMHSTNQPPKLQ
jgi:hypothetical protein